MRTRSLFPASRNRVLMLLIDASEARKDTKPAHLFSPDPAVRGIFLTVDVYLFNRFMNLILCSGHMI
jgi:hypothetical protein